MHNVLFSCSKDASVQCRISNSMTAQPGVDSALLAWLEDSSKQFDSLLGVLHDAHRSRGEPPS